MNILKETKKDLIKLKAQQILNKILLHNDLTDKYEYDKEDLISAYQISEEEADELFNLIQKKAKK